jgi:hypothetical protein
MNRIIAVLLVLGLAVAWIILNGPHEEAYKCTTKESEYYDFWEKTRCDPVAYFTIWLVAFTGILAVSTIVLWWSTRGLLRVTSESVKLARDEFLSTHRPKIRIQAVFLRAPEPPMPKLPSRTTSLPLPDINYYIYIKYIERGRSDGSLEKK